METFPQQFPLRSRKSVFIYCVYLLPSNTSNILDVRSEWEQALQDVNLILNVEWISFLFTTFGPLYFFFLRRWVQFTGHPCVTILSRTGITQHKYTLSYFYDFIYVILHSSSRHFPLLFHCIWHQDVPLNLSLPVHTNGPQLGHTIVRVELLILWCRFQSLEQDASTSFTHTQVHHSAKLQHADEMLPAIYQYNRGVPPSRLSHTVAVQKVPDSDSHFAMTAVDKNSNTEFDIHVTVHREKFL